MNLCIWKSRKPSHQFVASHADGLHLYFDSFELEEVETSLWFYQGSRMVGCVKASSSSMDSLKRTARKAAMLGAFNLGGEL
ncbi:hypothetical protein ACP3VW_09735 [Vibrio sp. DNB22_17_1]